MVSRRRCHLGRDRKTVRAHLSGERVPGERRPAGPDPFEVVEAYVRERLADDPHLWATALFQEVTRLGYPQSYVTFARKIRDRQLRPSCGACGRTRGQRRIHNARGCDGRLRTGHRPWASRPEHFHRTVGP